MPNKTIYVKDTDLPLLEQAQAELGDSVSSMFAEFLRERATKLTPEENRIIELINQIARKRESLKAQHSLPMFLEGEYAEAEQYAERSLKSLRSKEISKAKGLYWAANAFYERAERDEKELIELKDKVAGLLGEDNKKQTKRPIRKKLSESQTNR